MVKDIMGDAKLFGDGSRIANILTGAAAASAANGFTVIIELQSNANGLCTGACS